MCTEHNKEITDTFIYLIMIVTLGWRGKEGMVGGKRVGVVRVRVGVGLGLKEWETSN